MKQNLTTREEILKVCQNLMMTRKWESLNIRTVAEKCGVSIGSIYNYYQSKEELVFATVESIWKDIFHGNESEEIYQDFTKCILWIYSALEQGEKSYPDFYKLHMFSVLKKDNILGRNRMEETWQHIKKGMNLALSNDKRIRKDVFTTLFTKEDFVDLIFKQILSSVFFRDFSVEKVLVMIQKILY